MKAILLITILLSSFSFAGEPKSVKSEITTYCGNLYSMTVENDIWSYEGIKLKNKGKTYTSHSLEAILSVKEVVDPTTDVDASYHFFYRESSRKFFVCLTGKINENSTMEEVQRVRVWEKGEKLLDKKL